MDLSQKQQLSKEDLVKAAMWEELGKQRLDELPMEDNPNRPARHGPPHRVQGPRRATATPRTLSGNADGKRAAAMWNTAIAAGEFKDDDAAAVEGLDDFGGGRIYATRDEHVRTATRQALSHMNPIAMQRPEAFAQAVHGSWSCGQELAPRQQLVSGDSPTSRLGAVLAPNMPVRVFNTATNKVRERTYTTKNGKIISDIIHQGPVKQPPMSPSRPHTSSYSQAIAAQSSTGRNQTSTKTAGPQPVKIAPVIGTLLDKKRRTAVFEATVKYLKADSTDPTKYVWAIVVLCPTKPPYMGLLFLFVKKNDKYNLGNEVPLNIIQAAADKGSQVVIRIKENEIRESSHRMIFASSATAKDFLATISRLLSGGVDVVPTEAAGSADVALISSSPTITIAMPRTENQSTETPSTISGPTVAEIRQAEVPTAASPTKLSHIEALKCKPGADLADSQTGTPGDPVGVSSTHDDFKKKLPDGQYKEPRSAVIDKTNELKARVVDLLSDSEDAVTDTVASISTDVDSPAAPIMANDEQVLESPLFDLGADDYVSPTSEPTYQSNIDHLKGLDFSVGTDSSTTESDHVGHEVAREGDVLSDHLPTTFPAGGVHELVQVMRRMVQVVMVGFNHRGIGGDTEAERDRTVATIKQTVAGNLQELAPDPLFFPGLTLDEKLAIIKKFALDTVEAHAETSTNVHFVRQPLVHESRDSSAPSSATAVDVSPSRPTRIEYSAEQLLDVKGNAAKPPDWLGKLSFLPRARDDEAAKTKDVNNDLTNKLAVNRKPVKQGKEQSVVKQVRSSGPSNPAVTTHSISQTSTVSVMPFGRDLTTRPAAPPTPAVSPSTAVAPSKTSAASSSTAAPSPALKVAKLELKFERLSLKDESTPVSLLVPSLKVGGVPTTAVPTSLLDGEPDKVQTVGKLENASRSTERSATVADPKVSANGPTSLAKETVQAHQPTPESSGSRDLETMKRELKTKVQAATFNLANQPQPGAAKFAVHDAENSRPQATAAVAKHNGLPNGKSPAHDRLNPEAAAFDQPVFNGQTGTTQQTAPGGGGLRGLNCSRWAEVAMHKVEREGRFTGIHSKK